MADVCAGLLRGLGALQFVLDLLQGELVLGFHQFAASSAGHDQEEAGTPERAEHHDHDQHPLQSLRCEQTL